MKTLTGYRSLLLAGGLLLICLVDLRLDQVRMDNMPATGKAQKHVVIAKCAVDPDGGSYLKIIAGKLFPVLKNLNLM